MIDSTGNGSTITLPWDCRAISDHSALVIPSGKTLVLDLNGHNIDRALTSAGPDGNVITNKGTLTIKDSKGGGVITGGFNTASGGGIVNEGTLTVSGGAISCNKANEGGAVYNPDDAILILEGGSLIDNGAVTDGGAVMSSGTVNVNGGLISGNTAAGNGGGLYICDGSTANISGGTIENNSAEGNGGGICMVDSGTVLTVRNSDISGNTAAGNGGGIYYGDGRLAVSGRMIVKDNSDDNIYMVNASKSLIIEIAGALDDEEMGEDSILSITLESGGGIVTNGLCNNGTIEQFASDDERYIVIKNVDGEIELCEKATITFVAGDANAASGASVSSAVDTVTTQMLADYIAIRSGSLPNGVSIRGITAMLEADNTFRLYLNFKNVDPTGFTYSIDGNTTTLKQRADGLYYLELDAGVYSNKLQETHNYSVSDGTDTYTITASVLTYARSLAVRSKGTEEEKNLGKALYLYNQAAVAAFG